MRKTAVLLAAMMLFTVILSAGIGTGAKAYAAPGDIITFPDSNFMQALLDNDVDTSGDGKITQQEMSVAPSLTIDNGSITSISGIEYATGLISLTIAGTSITSIPSSISALTALKSLEIKNNTLIGNAGIPAELWGLTGLENLTLYDIGLTSIPTAIENLTNLTGLNLQWNAIPSLPTQIGSLTKLKSINVWHNRLTSISSAIFSGMPSLSSLDIVENYLDPQATSDDYAQIDTLIKSGVTVTYATQNACPVTLNTDGGTCAPLAKASFYYGESVTLPSAAKTGFTFAGWDTDGDGSKDKNAGDTVQIAPSPVTASLEFKAIYNYTVTFKTQSYGTISGGTADVAVLVSPGGTVSSVPVIAPNTGYVSLGWYEGNTAMTEGQILAAVISGNRTFTAKYEAIGTIHFTDTAFKDALYAAGADCIDVDGFITEEEMASLPSLSLITGGFTDLTGIGYAVNIESLLLGTGNVTALPAEIGNLMKLKSLTIVGNPIASLPTEITGITTLVNLTLSDCGLTALPANVSGITTLTTLDLSGNRFAAIPSGIAGLTGLTALNLSGNMLTTVPNNFFTPLASLASLDLQSNYLNPGAAYAGLPSCADLGSQHTYAISLDFNGGTGAALPKGAYYYNETIPLPAAAKTYYQFVGWDTDGDGDADTSGAGTAAFAPVPPNSAASKSYKAVYRSSDAALSGLGLSAGAYLTPAAFDPAVTGYTITLYDYVGDVTITPSKSSPLAAMTINGITTGSTSISLAPSASTTVTIALTAEDGVTARTYTLTVRRASPANLDLAALSCSPAMDSAFSPSDTAYTVLLTAAQGSASIAAAQADGAAEVRINGVVATSAAVSVDQGMSVDVPVTVSAPASTDRTKTYTVTLKRATTLAAFTGAPKLKNVITLSPGGTNRLTFIYTMNGPGAVKLEIYANKKWVQAMSREETSAGVKTFDWNGKLYGKYLKVGTYKARITPSAYGMTGVASAVSFKVVSYPSVYWKNVPKSFLATGTAYTLCSFRVKYPTDAAVRVYNSRGRIVATARSFEKLPVSSAYTTVQWDGRATGDNNAGLSEGALVPAGRYTVRITTGAKTYSKTFSVIRYSKVTFYRLPTSFRATGKFMQLCRFRVDFPTNATVYVYNAAGNAVAKVKAYGLVKASGKYTTVYWNGTATEGNEAGLATGALVPAGKYTIRIDVVGKTWSKSIKITR